MNVPTSIDKCEMVALVLCTCNLNLIISAVAGLSICTYGGVYEVNKHEQQLPTQHTNTGPQRLSQNTSPVGVNCVARFSLPVLVYD